MLEVALLLSHDTVSDPHKLLVEALKIGVHLTWSEVQGDSVVTVRSQLAQKLEAKKVGPQFAVLLVRVKLNWNFGKFQIFSCINIK